MNKILRTWSLMSDCWQVLRQDKALLVFPLISGICCLMLLGSFAVPLYLTGAWHPPGHDAPTTKMVTYYGSLFLFYFANYFVIVFFNAGIVACAAARMSGGNPTIADGFRTAASRLPVIIGWALLAATVGMLLRIIEERSEKIGRFAAALLGMAWTVASFLVVPVLVIENKGPLAALKDSTVLLKKTWGEQVVSNFSFGSIFGLLMIPGIALVVLGAYLGGGPALIACIGIAFIYWMVLALVQSALQSIFQAALYLYARDGHVPEGFRDEVLSGAIG